MKINLNSSRWLPVLFVVAVLAMTACKGKKSQTSDVAKDTEHTDTAIDSTLYGVCGEGTAMHSLELITDMNDTLHLLIDENNDMAPVVLGGLMVGDRMAVIKGKADGEDVATKVINLTTLMGEWSSLDKHFTIEEGGEVRSTIKEETHPWTTWKILNGKLLLNKDTFSIQSLGRDSLALENDKGIFVYQRKP